MEILEDFYGRRLPKERVPDVFVQQAQVMPAFKSRAIAISACAVDKRLIRRHCFQQGTVIVGLVSSLGV